ncbi:LysM peptidoglycan-binding domain-containing protein [Mesobacillus maritimus]|uniref:LysM peptidoglycan-binding domain-containing protein n=1 Tax=Mesobacillus maritimus TaxID=1643336 RepID=UPI00203E3070|nr:LysM peptidoglycan-binding domain-containing protein [Mesobacillus maritimus]MCM3584607.1 LysM peptidoglycan-binding domain-containing protein [Mesobacillus maritimus]
MKKIVVFLLSLIFMMIISLFPSQVYGQNLSIYDVKPGDTLSAIAKRYHTSAQEIKKVNKLRSDQIYIGQKLKIYPHKYTTQGQFILLTREEFKLWLFNQNVTRKINKIQHHHTWAPSYRHFKGSNHFAILNGMKNHHVNKMKWRNIAQNLTTFPDGRIAISRPFNDEPEGSIGPIANSGAIMIENLGNFDIGKDQMTQEHKETIVYVTALLCLKFGLTPSIDSITYHHWWHYGTKQRVLDNHNKYSVKSCPGTNFFGGNNTAHARNNFYPLVVKKMEEIRATMR